MKRLINRIIHGRALDQWQATHVLAATKAMNDLAATLIVEAEDEIASLGFTSKTIGQADFLSARIKKLVRSAAEELADELLEAANRDLAVLVDAEAVRIRVSDYPVQPDSLLASLGQLLSAALPFNVTTTLHGRVRDYVRSTLVKGSKDAPAVLEQLLAAYADAANRALAL